MADAACLLSPCQRLLHDILKWETRFQAQFTKSGRYRSAFYQAWKRAKLSSNCTQGKWRYTDMHTKYPTTIFSQRIWEYIQAQPIMEQVDSDSIVYRS